MEPAGRHLAALCREIVRVALRMHAQQRELDVHGKRLALLESAVADVATSAKPAPLQIRRSEPTKAETLTNSFEARLAARPDEGDAPGL